MLILHLRFTYVADAFIIMMSLKFLQHNLRGVWAPKDTVIDWEKIRPSGFHVLKWRWIVENTQSQDP